MKDYDVFEIVPCKSNMKVVPIKWVFTIKSDGEEKARLVSIAVDCRDSEVYTKEETAASPTSNSVSFR